MYSCNKIKNTEEGTKRYNIIKLYVIMYKYIILKI